MSHETLFIAVPQSEYLPDSFIAATVDEMNYGVVLISEEDEFSEDFWNMFVLARSIAFTDAVKAGTFAILHQPPGWDIPEGI